MNIPVGIIVLLLGTSVIPPENNLPVRPTRHTGNHPGVISLVLTIIAFFLFWLEEKRAPEPLVTRSVFTNRAYTFQNLDILFLQMGLAGVMFIMPFCLEIVKGVSTATVGAILLSLPVGNILTGPIAGIISDVIGTKK